MAFQVIAILIRELSRGEEKVLDLCVMVARGLFVHCMNVHEASSRSYRLA
jgi:hypothetical protein